MKEAAGKNSVLGVDAGEKARFDDNLPEKIVEGEDREVTVTKLSSGEDRGGMSTLRNVV